MRANRFPEFLHLGQVLQPPAEVPGGLLHSMYAVATSTGKYAVKVLNEEIMMRPQAHRNMALSERVASLMAEAIPAVAALSIDGEQVHAREGLYWMVFPWVEGRSVYAPAIGAAHCRVIGDLLGKMHALNARLDGVPHSSPETFDWEGVFAMASARVDSSAPWLARLERSLEALTHWSDEASAACDVSCQVLSHRDLDPKNVLWDGLRAYVIDWEAAGYVNPNQELLETLRYWATDERGVLRRDCFDALLSSYQTHMNLARVEWRRALAGSFTGMLGWLEYNVRRAAGLTADDERETNLGARQALLTLDELFRYQAQQETLLNWLGSAIESPRLAHPATVGL